MSGFSYIAPLLIVSAVSQDITNCDYGQFEVDPSTGNCAFDCEYDDRYVAISTLSFAFIKEQCRNVEYAAILYPDDCASLTDLVWPRDCECPFCGCSTETSTPEYDTLTKYVEKECVSILCQSVVDDAGEEALVRQFNSELSVSDAVLWNEFACPPQTCTVATSVGTYYEHTHEYTQGEHWFPGNSDGTCGDSFCFCGSDGNENCANFSAITSSTDDHDLLKYKFLDECRYYLTDCLDDGSRVINSYSSWCDGCYSKRCDCGTHAVDDEWWTVYPDEDGESSCAKCTCTAGSNGNYADCWDVDVDTCGSADALQCHADWGNVTSESTTYAVGELSATECSGQCGWDIYYDDEDEVSDVWWGCNSDWICEAFVGENTCVYYNTEVRYTDCFGLKKTEIVKGYQSCCSDEDNCNHVDIDITACTENSAYSDFMKELYECVFASYSLWVDGCWEDNEITCSRIENYFVPQMRCFCTAYGSLYNTLTSDGAKAELKEELSYLGAELSKWNDVFGCTIVASCDLEAGGEFTSGTDVKDAVAKYGWLKPLSPDDSGPSGGNSSAAAAHPIWLLCMACSLLMALIN